MATLKDGVIQRFWKKVQKPSAESECWIWTGAVVKSGHGLAWNGERVVPAHRLALEISGSPVPGDRLACHRCNNPKCVNPSHLYAGTHADNARDAIAAGSFHFNPAPRGEANRSAKLTCADVAEIRRLSGLGFSQRELGRQFGVTHCAIGKVLHGETWSHA
jgi:hypothetical protein